MPIYEYTCTDCGHELEALQKISDDPLKQCPACNNDTLKKKISAAAFHLKGTGWYETDFKGKKKETGSNSSNTDSSSSSDSSKTSSSSDDKKSSGDKKTEKTAGSKDKQAA